MDDMDKRILRILQEDARITNLKLAEKVNLSPTPCLARVKRLENDGVIERYSAVIDPKTVDLAVCAMVLIKIGNKTREADEAFATAIKKIRTVTECYTLAGSYDYLCKVRARDIEEYDSIVRDELSRLPNLSGLETLFVLRTLIESRGLPVR